MHNILIDINYNYEAYNTSSASCILKVVCIFPSNGHIRLFRRLGPVGVGFHKEKSLQSSESWIIALTYPHKYPMILCIHIDRWKCRFCRVIRVILTARDENHTTSGILRYFSSQRQISISLNTNMHQIISTYLLDKNQALKHVRRSNSPVLSAKNWFSFSRNRILKMTIDLCLSSIFLLRARNYVPVYVLLEAFSLTQNARSSLLTSYPPPSSRKTPPTVQFCSLVDLSPPSSSPLWYIDSHIQIYHQRNSTTSGIDKRNPALVSQNRTIRFSPLRVVEP